MPRLAPVTLLLAACLLTAGCANSVLYDEDYRRDVAAEHAAANARIERFWGVTEAPPDSRPRGSIWDPDSCDSRGWRTTSFCVR